MVYLNKGLKVIGFSLLVSLSQVAAASQSELNVPDSFEPLKLKKLDQAWIKPNFEIANYEKVAIKWSAFDYRPGKTRFDRKDRNANYELSDKSKKRIEEYAQEIFSKELGRLKTHQLVDLADADDSTLVIQLSVSDFVNNIPSPQQITGQVQLFRRQFGAATLTINFLDGNSLSPVLKGQVRNEFELFEFNNLRFADIVTANRQTQLQLERWAVSLKKNITHMASL
jgi:hypothetical protein